MYFFSHNPVTDCVLF